MANPRGVYEKNPDSGIWYIHYQHPVGTYDCGIPNCRGRHRERVGRKSDAKTLYNKRKAQVLSGEKLPELQRKPVPFGDLIDDAVSYALENHKQSRDVVSKAALVKKDLGHLPAEALTSAVIEGWIRKRKVEPATQNRYKAFFSLCFREGIHSKKIKDNPAKQVRRKREPEGRKRYLTAKEYATLISTIRTREQQIAATVSILTGMRLSEQYSLEWIQVDLERRSIHLTKTKNGQDRDIPMVKDVSDALEELFKLTGAKRNKGVPVFKRKRGGEGQVQTEWFEAALDRAKIDDYTWHNNRHTFCSWYMMAGGDLLELKEIAGHKTLSMTARYSHLSPGHLQKGMDRLGQMVQRGPAKVTEWPENRTAPRTATGA
jgi:integrase